MGEEEGKGSLPGSNVHEVDKGPRLAEAAGGQTQGEEGHGDAQAEADPGQEHGEQAGEEHPWREADGEAGRLPEVPPHPAPRATCVLTYGGEEPPDHKEREDLPGEEEVGQQAPQDDADKGHAKQQGGQEATLRTGGESVQVHAHPRQDTAGPRGAVHTAASR